MQCACQMIAFSPINVTIRNMHQGGEDKKEERREKITEKRKMDEDKSKITNNRNNEEDQEVNSRNLLHQPCHH